MSNEDDLCKFDSPKRPQSLKLSSTTASQSWTTPTSVMPTEKPTSLAQKTLAQQKIINKNCRVVPSYCRRDESPIASLEKIWEDRKSTFTDDEDDRSVKTASPKRRSFAGLTAIGRSSENNLMKTFWKKRFFCKRRRSIPVDQNPFLNGPVPSIIEER